MVKKTTGKKKNTVTVDMEGVESGGGRPCRDGRWKMYPTSCELTESQAGNDMLKFRWKVTSGPDAGAVIWDNVSLTPQALWRLKTLMETMGMDVPDGSLDIDPDDFVGEDNEIVCEITNEKYQGKDQPRITGFGGEESEDDDSGEDDEESDKPSKKGSKSSKKPSKSSKESDEDDDDDDDDDDDSSDDDDDDDDEDEKPAKKGKTSDKKLGKAPKIKEGSKVQFTDDDDKLVKGTVTEIDDDTVKIEDKKGTEWEVPLDQVELQ